MNQLSIALSPPSRVVLGYLDVPRRILHSKCTSWLGADDCIRCSWNVTYWLEKRWLIRQRPDGLWVRTAAGDAVFLPAERVLT